MSELTHAQVAARVLNLIDSVPNAVSGAMPEYVDQARIFLNNVLRVSIGSNVITDAYHNMVINLTALKAISRIESIGVDFDWTLGQFSVRKGSQSQNTGQAGMIATELNAEIKGVMNVNNVEVVNG